MPAFKNLSGQRFGRLTVLERGPNQSSRTMWSVRCDCGAERLVQANHLVSGRQVSCGCHRNEQSRKPGRNLRHGFFTAAYMAERGKRDGRIWSQYQLTARQFEALLEKQGGVCAICAATPNQWYVDHDHSCCPSHKKTCGKCVRGLLCRDCNTGLGRFQDDPDRLRRAINYLGVGA